MAVFATEKKKKKRMEEMEEDEKKNDASLHNGNEKRHSRTFIFPHCCSPEIIFGLRTETENAAQHTMKDLGNPEVVDPVLKYSDLYLNESYVKNIICFKCDNPERVYERLKDEEEEEEDEEEEEEEEEEDVTMRSEIECKDHMAPPKELLLDKSSRW